MELLQGKTAIVTGGTRGIGLAVVRVFLQNGARVALFGSRQETADRAVAALKFEEPGWDVIGLAPDLADFASVQAAVEAVRARFGGVDILVTISQMTPGPIAINAATFVGLRVAGLSGALAATVGCMLPSCVLVTLLARLYLRYRKLSLLQGVLTSLRPAVVAMIASAGVSILVTAFWDEAVTFAGANWRLVVIFASSLLLLRRTKLSPILVMTLAGAANLLLELIPLPF